MTIWPFQKSSFDIFVFVLGLSNWTYVLNESESSQMETTEKHGGWTYETFGEGTKEVLVSSPELLINTPVHHTYSD